MKKIAIIILIILSAIGVWMINVRLSEGMQVTNLNSVSWGIWVSLYIYCIGLSAGSFLLSTMIYVFGMYKFEKMGRISLLSALVALLTGLCFVWIDLGHPWRFYKIFTGWQASSVLAWESALYMSYIVILLLELWLLTRNDLFLLAKKNQGFKRKFYKILSLGWKRKEVKEDREKSFRKKMKWIGIIGIIGVPNAIGVHGGTGALFAVVAAKPYWFSGLFPIIFLVSALVSGCGLMLMAYSFFGKKDNNYNAIVIGLRDLLVLFIGIDVLLFVSDLLVALYGGIPDHVAIIKNMLFGEYWYVFWFGQVLLAWVIPMFTGTLKATKSNSRLLGIAGLCTILGIIAVRLNLVIPAYTYPQLNGMDTAFAGVTRLHYDYFPSGIEFMSTIGVLSMAILLFIILWRIIPMFDIDKDSVHISILGGNENEEIV